MNSQTVTAIGDELLNRLTSLNSELAGTQTPGKHTVHLIWGAEQNRKTWALGRVSLELSQLEISFCFLLKNIFPNKNTQREKSVGGRNVALPPKGYWWFVLPLWMPSWKTSWKPCTFRFTDDMGHLLPISQPSAQRLARASCRLCPSCSFSVAVIHWGKPRVHKFSSFQPWESNGCCWLARKVGSAEVSETSHLPEFCSGR